LIQIANKYNKKFLLDCSGNQLIHALKEPFFGLHINEHEATETFGDSNIHEVKNSLGHSVELVALTKGKDGLYLSFKEQMVHASVAIDKVISTVGSGDCLTAGIAYAIAEQLSIEQIASYGVSCGAANCLYEKLGIFQPQDVRSLLSSVKLNHLAYAE